jgi:MoaA/NifB/PqqE/SkfB family radical SAM enzyme
MANGATNHPVTLGTIARGLPRAWDDLPLWGQLNVTWKCNLDCSYCTEYDNARDHVPAETLRARIDHCKRLGALHVDLVGGEPVMHPDLASLMRHVTSLGMTTGMTTNGFLLTERILEELLDAGLGRLQISVDSLKPKAGIPKSLKTLRGKIALAAKYPIWFRVNTVICEETVDEVVEVAELCFSLGVGINFSVVHHRGRLAAGDNAGRFLEKVAWLRERKKQGAVIDTPYYLMHYYERALTGRPMDWTCQAGSKTFYISPDGHFHWCYHIPSQVDFLSVTRADLSANRDKKGCETECGVDCVIHTSLPYSNKAEVLAVEARDRLDALRQRARRALPVLAR